MIKRQYHPGSYLRDNLEALEMSAKEFAFRTGISERTMSDLLNEKGSVTFDIAIKLGNFFGTGPNLWQNLQTAWDEYQIETQKREEMANDYNLLKDYKNYLTKNNIISSGDSKEALVEKARKFIGVNFLSTLTGETMVASFKEQKGGNASTFAQNFWLAYALTEARKLEIKPYERTKLFCSIAKMRSLTKLRPYQFYPKLQQILGECGVRFVYIPYMPKSNIYGATKWLSSNSVMMAVSNRGERADTFWFTFFHELAHVLMQHKRYCLLQTNEEDSEADLLARQVIISDKQWKEFVDAKDYSEKSIVKFARSLDILPLIILGRLIKEGYVKEYGPTYKNLLVTYTLEDFQFNNENIH